MDFDFGATANNLMTTVAHVGLKARAEILLRQPQPHPAQVFP